MKIPPPSAPIPAAVFPVTELLSRRRLAPGINAMPGPSPAAELLVIALPRMVTELGPRQYTPAPAAKDAVLPLIVQFEIVSNPAEVLYWPIAPPPNCPEETF